MCAMTGLNILSLVLLGEGVRRTGEGFVGCQEVRRSRGQYIENQHSPQPSPIVEGVNIGDQSGVPHEIDCHPEFVSGSHLVQQQVKHHANSLKRTYSLINLFSYSPHKKAAFTLAEVLITLGIIGIVAAMTMPSLIANHKQKELETGLKKAYSVLQQALLRMSVDRGDVVPSFGLREFYSEYIKYFNNAIDCGIDTSKNFACGLAQDYKDYSGVVKITSAYTDDGQFVLPDGMNIYIQNENGNEDRNANIYISVDVNGAKKRPNKWGHDLFTFQLMSDGKLMPMGMEGTDFYEKECSRTTASNKNGIGCTYEAINNPSYFKSLP